MKISEIKPYKNNAKKHPDDQLRKIAKSIKAFGWVQPIVVDKEGNIIIGHGRYFAYDRYSESMKLPEPKIEVASELDEEQVKALRLADNKLNESGWNIGLAVGDLIKMSEEMFNLTGFKRDILAGMESLNEKKEEEFTSEILEENNYVVFIFNSSIDWVHIQEKFGLSSVNSLDSKEGYIRKGTGRVLDGKKLLEIIEKNGNNNTKPQEAK